MIRPLKAFKNAASAAVSGKCPAFSASKYRMPGIRNCIPGIFWKWDHSRDLRYSMQIFASVGPSGVWVSLSTIMGSFISTAFL